MIGKCKGARAARVAPRGGEPRHHDRSERTLGHGTQRAADRGLAIVGGRAVVAVDEGHQLARARRAETLV